MKKKKNEDNEQSLKQSLMPDITSKNAELQEDSTNKKGV
jgi:hypothetical protein